MAKVKSSPTGIGKSNIVSKPKKSSQGQGKNTKNSRSSRNPSKKKVYRGQGK